MEEECSVGWCNSRLEKENCAFLEAYEQFASSVNNLLAPLQSLVRPMDLSLPPKEQIGESLSSAFGKLDEAVKGNHFFIFY